MNGLDPKVVVSLVVGGVFAILLPVGLGWWVWRRWRFPLTVFALGALSFAVSQLFTRIPLVAVVQNQLKDALGDPTVQAVWIGVLSLTAGLFEETARYLAFKYGLKERANWKTAIGLGIGHGGLESAVLIGLSMLGSAVTALMLFKGMIPTSGLSPEQTEALEKTKQVFLEMKWWTPLLGGYERIGAMALHIALSVVVLQAYLRRKMGWYVGAILYHTVVNAVAVVVMKAWGAVAAEGVLTVFMAISIWMIVRLRARTPDERVASA